MRPSYVRGVTLLDAGMDSVDSIRFLGPECRAIEKPVEGDDQGSLGWGEGRSGELRRCEPQSEWSPVCDIAVLSCAVLWSGWLWRCAFCADPVQEVM